ncbi:hypothetical protein M758_UG265600 [Ceratodon purpureus]|nr:hypothetical protein M758_UG265600 [Ceratodon purpureus]
MAEIGSIARLVGLIAWAIAALVLKIAELVFEKIDGWYFGRRRFAHRDVTTVGEDQVLTQAWEAEDVVGAGIVHARAMKLETKIGGEASPESRVWQGKCYAIRRGRQTGVVQTWAKCEERVHKFRGCRGSTRSSWRRRNDQTPS